MNILLLCDFRPHGASTVHDHLDALERHSGHEVFRLSMFGDLPDALDLEAFDAVIVHYSLAVGLDEAVSPLARYRLRRYRGLKAVFLQDEYRWVNRTLDALDYMQVQVLFSCLAPPDLERVYVPDRLPALRRRENVLTGYVPERLPEHPVPNYAARSIDVGYRARRLSAACGSLGREKHVIADRFGRAARRHGLVTDISCAESDRLYGEQWVEFVAACRAMLGTESGASVMDFDGTIAPAVAAAERCDPDVPYEVLEARYFPGLDGQVRMNQISPRCFESAALRTMMVLYEGAYSGILEPWRHYVPLRKDHENEDEVIEAIRDAETWGEMTARAHREIASNPDYSYASFGRFVGRVLSEEAPAPIGAGRRPAVSRTPFAGLAARSRCAVDVSLARTDRLSRLHVAFERRVLSHLPGRAARRVESVARLAWRMARAAYRRVRTGWTLARRRRRTIGLPLRFAAAPWAGELERELAALERYRAFGSARVAAGHEAEFVLCVKDTTLAIAVMDAVDAPRAGTPVAAVAQLQDCRDIVVDLGAREGSRVNAPLRLPRIGAWMAVQPGCIDKLLRGAEGTLAWVGVQGDGSRAQPCAGAQEPGETE